MTDIAKQLIDYFHLQPLPGEGGYLIPSYRSSEMVGPGSLPERYPDAHPFGGAALYLFDSDPDCFSALHRLPTDEIFHFYLGDPVEMLLLYPDGKSERVILGQDVLAGQKVQFVVPRGAYQGSHLVDGGQYALMGTTMAPGFVESDYEGGERDDLIRRYPSETDLIRRLTRV